MYNFQSAAAHFDRLPKTWERICAIDTETTGLHLRHGAKGFMVAATWDDGESKLWQARVDPMTRQPIWTKEQRAEIHALLHHDEWCYTMTNSKFDTNVLGGILDPSLPIDECPYYFNKKSFLAKCHETIGMHHALNNKESHALKDAAIKYAGLDDEDEAELHRETRANRHLAQSLGWAVASSSTCHIKKAPKKGWAVMDMWLLREIAYYNWEQSEAYIYLFGPQVSWLEAKTEVCSCCGGPHWSPDCFYKAPKSAQAHYLSIASVKEGWEWHPPEINSDQVHKYYTLCGKYCTLDTLRTVVLTSVFLKALQKTGLTPQYLEHRLNVLMTHNIESHGVCFNKALSLTERELYVQDLENAQSAVSFSISKFGYINPKSPDQLRTVLYDHFGLPVRRRTVNKKKRDQVGKPTVDKDFLAEIVAASKPEDPAQLAPPTKHRNITKDIDHRKAMIRWHSMLQDDPANALFAFCCSVLQYKKAANNIGQIDNFLFNCLDEEDGYGYLYSHINPYGTKTTRQGASNPNPQNISKGGKQKKSLEFMFKVKRTLRNLFGPKPGREWWSVDYTQLQLVIFAVMSGEDKLLYALQHGVDAHDNMARIIFDLPTNVDDPDFIRFAPTDTQRVVAKGANFGFTFGAQEEKLRLITGMDGIYDLLLDRLPGVQRFLAKMERQVRQHGYVFTQGGYRLFVPEETPYAGSVYAIQGTEGEIVKRATYGVQHYLEQNVKSSDDMYITLPVHDELNYDAKVGFGINYIGQICDVMEDAALSYGIPAKVVPKLCGSSWAKGIEYKLEAA